MGKTDGHVAPSPGAAELRRVLGLMEVEAFGPRRRFCGRLVAYRRGQPVRKPARRRLKPCRPAGFRWSLPPTLPTPPRQRSAPGPEPTPTPPQAHLAEPNCPVPFIDIHHPRASTQGFTIRKSRNTHRAAAIFAVKASLPAPRVGRRPRPSLHGSPSVRAGPSSQASGVRSERGTESSRRLGARR